MRYSIAIMAAGTLLLAGCQPPDDDKQEQDAAVPHPPIEETGDGGQVGSQGGGEASPATAGGTADAPSAQGHGEDLNADQAAVYQSSDYRIQVTFPRELEVVNHAAGELEGVDNAGQADQDAAWKAFAGDDMDGQRLLTLAVPGDRDLRFQLGASRGTQGLSHCKDQPSEQAGDTEATRTLDGVPFRRFEITETDDQGFRTVQSYRATYGEACYAIDLIARGDGEGDGAAEALTRLQTALDGVAFTE